MNDASRQTYTVSEAARILGISLTMAYRHVRAGDIPAIKLGGRYLIPREGLARLLAGAPVERIEERAETTTL